jgi:hypothetical protein
LASIADAEQPSRSTPTDRRSPICTRATTRPKPGQDADAGRGTTDRGQHRASARAAASGERRLNRRAVQMPQIGGADDLSAGAFRRASLEGAMSGLTSAPTKRVHDRQRRHPRRRVGVGRPERISGLRGSCFACSTSRGSPWPTRASSRRAVSPLVGFSCVRRT